MVCALADVARALAVALNLPLWEELLCTARRHWQEGGNHTISIVKTIAAGNGTGMLCKVSDMPNHLIKKN